MLAGIVIAMLVGAVVGCGTYNWHRSPDVLAGYAKGDGDIDNKRSSGRSQDLDQSFWFVGLQWRGYDDQRYQRDYDLPDIIREQDLTKAEVEEARGMLDQVEDALPEDPADWPYLLFPAVAFAIVWMTWRGKWWWMTKDTGDDESEASRP